MGDIEIRILDTSEVGTVEKQLPIGSPPQNRDIFEKQLKGEVTVMVVWLNGAPIGLGVIRWLGPRDPEIAKKLIACPEIYCLEVLTGYQSKGIGSKLIQSFENMASQQGYSQVGLGAAITNVRATSLYWRLGYRDCKIGKYIDAYSYVDDSGERIAVRDTCIFLVKNIQSKG